MISAFPACPVSQSVSHWVCNTWNILPSLVSLLPPLYHRHQHDRTDRLADETTRLGIIMHKTWPLLHLSLGKRCIKLNINSIHILLFQVQPNGMQIRLTQISNIHSTSPIYSLYPSTYLFYNTAQLQVPSATTIYEWSRSLGRFTVRHRNCPVQPLQLFAEEIPYGYGDRSTTAADE